MEEFPIFVKLQGYMRFLVQISEIGSKASNIRVKSAPTTIN
jgi:hypothetical protein